MFLRRQELYALFYQATVIIVQQDAIFI